MGVATVERPTLTEEFRRVPIDSIKLGSNVRHEVGDVKELAESIRSVGILQPLVVTQDERREPPSYTLVAGYRRLAAAKLIKLPDVPVMLRTFTDPERLEAQLIENLQRRDIEPVEEGRAMQQLLDLGRTRDQLAKRIGRTTELVAQRLALLGLPSNAVEALNKHRITIDDAVQLTKLTDHPDKITEVLKQNRGDVGWAVRQATNELAIEKKRTENEAKLKEANVKVLRLVHGWQAPEGSALLGDRYGGVKVAVTAHAKLDCHAAGIDSQGAIVYLCTKPKNHPGAIATGSPSISPAEKKRRQEMAAEKKIANAAAQSRRGFLAGFMKKASGKSNVAHTVAVLLETVSYAHRAPAALLAGLPDGEPGLLHDALPSLFREEASMLRAALACALAIGESTLTGTNYGGVDPVILARHLELLKGAGYKLTSWEREKLSEAKEAIKAESQDAAAAVTKLKANAQKAHQDPLGIAAKQRPVARPANG